MKWTITTTAALLGLVATASTQAESTAYEDPDTGITFQSYESPDGISLRLALPDTATDGGAYDALVQIEGPASIGWVGWAWGGQMTYNPLTIAWPNGDEVVHSSRMAYGYSSPAAYADASYTILPKGTGVTAAGRLKFTALCGGCTAWADFAGEPLVLDASQPAAFAYAFATKAVASPASNTSAFGIHEGLGHWSHDLPAAQSPRFADWVAANLGGGPSNGTANGTAAGAATGSTVRSLRGRRAAAGARRHVRWRV